MIIIAQSRNRENLYKTIQISFTVSRLSIASRHEPVSEMSNKYN